MNQHETLCAILAESIKCAQQEGFDDSTVVATAVTAAQAFKAGLAAFYDASPPSLELPSTSQREEFPSTEHRQ